MILSLGKPSTKRPIICWPVFGFNGEEPRWVESPLGCGLVDDLYFRSQLPLDEYLQRQYIRLVAPFNALSPGELQWTNFDLKGEKVRNTDVLWVPDTTVGRAFHSILSVVLFELGWDVDVVLEGKISTVVAVEDGFIERRGTPRPIRKVVLE